MEAMYQGGGKGCGKAFFAGETKTQGSQKKRKQREESRDHKEKEVLKVSRLRRKVGKEAKKQRKQEMKLNDLKNSVAQLCAVLLPTRSRTQAWILPEPP